LEMWGFETTMKGRFRKDRMRCARRAGSIERVKFAEVRSCCVVRGGRPCLGWQWQLAGLRINVTIGDVLYEVCKSERVEWKRGQA
jgi:hypothetical protein